MKSISIKCRTGASTNSARQLTSERREFWRRPPNVAVPPSVAFRVVHWFTLRQIEKQRANLISLRVVCLIALTLTVKGGRMRAGMARTIAHQLKPSSYNDLAE